MGYFIAKPRVKPHNDGCWCVLCTGVYVMTDEDWRKEHGLLPKQDGE